MITITDYFCLVENLNSVSTKTDHNKQLITITMITLSGFNCNVFVYWYNSVNVISYGISHSDFTRQHLGTVFNFKLEFIMLTEKKDDNLLNYLPRKLLNHINEVKKLNRVFL